MESQRPWAMLLVEKAGQPCQDPREVSPRRVNLCRRSWEAALRCLVTGYIQQEVIARGDVHGLQSVYSVAKIDQGVMFVRIPCHFLNALVRLLGWYSVIDPGTCVRLSPGLYSVEQRVVYPVDFLRR